jgi:hypothetical protein
MRSPAGAQQRHSIELPGAYLQLIVVLTNMLIAAPTR